MENFCFFCNDKHKGHDVVNFGKLLSKKKENEEFVEKVQNVEKEVDVIIKVLQKFKENIDVYVKIIKMLNEKVDKMNVNYELLKSLKNISEMSSIKMDLDEILNAKNMNENFKKILSINDMMTVKSAKSLTQHIEMK